MEGSLMKAEAWIFGVTTIFLILVTPAYWLITDASEHGGDWTGTSALTMTMLLAGMVIADGRPPTHGRLSRGPQGR